MDRMLSPDTGDYTGTRTTSLHNAAYLRLVTPLGSWWADKVLGSRLHELVREKDLSRVFVLARQYAEQALAPLQADGRATDIRVSVHNDRPGWCLLWVDIIQADGQTVTFKHPVRVS
ncbi:TPA: phage GP46 family protein [Salmonella enterica]|uniref:phage GP46 family protein n=1 Tax=Salmonella sp. SG203 TaxID=2555397 RepID=UPI0015835B15|nr:phage GP46 family protein [Salmonella sp. SG203]